MKAVDIADQLYRELSSPTDLSIPAISYWLRTNLGGLNNHINTCYELGPAPNFDVQQTYTNQNGEKVTEEIDAQGEISEHAEIWDHVKALRRRVASFN